MAIERFSVSLPCSYKGLEDFITPELEDFAFELQRRLIQNQDAQNTALTQQVVVDKQILPLLQRGQASTTNITLVTNLDTENVVIQAAMWEG